MCVYDTLNSHSVTTSQHYSQNLINWINMNKNNNIHHHRETKLFCVCTISPRPLGWSQRDLIILYVRVRIKISIRIYCSDNKKTIFGSCARHVKNVAGIEPCLYLGWIKNINHTYFRSINWATLTVQSQ